MNSAKPALAILAGGDELPVQLVKKCRQEGREFFVLGFDGITDMNLFSDVPAAHKAQVRIGAVGDALSHIQKSGAKEVVLAGKFTRPTLRSLRPDATAVRLLPRVAAALLSGGDNALLTKVIPLIEEQGVTIIGCHDILPELLAPEGTLGTINPDENDKKKIILGIEAAKKLGEKDAGQAVVVIGETILEENKDGTDALLARSKKYKRRNPEGVLVKMEKPGQDRRVDLPAIGLKTVEKAHAAGLKGIAYHGGSTLIIGDKKTMIAAADRYGMFLFGVRA